MKYSIHSTFSSRAWSCSAISLSCFFISSTTSGGKKGLREGGVKEGEETGLLLPRPLSCLGPREFATLLLEERTGDRADEDPVLEMVKLIDRSEE